jgi:hypothetical protein
VHRNKEKASVMPSGGCDWNTFNYKYLSSRRSIRASPPVLTYSAENAAEIKYCPNAFEKEAVTKERPGRAESDAIRAMIFSKIPCFASMKQRGFR